MMIKPIITEKSVAQAKDKTYMFEVSPDATKIELKSAVKERYSVDVATVNIVIRKGKVRNSYRKGKRPIPGRRSDVKIAYVRLAGDDTIKEFDEILDSMEEA